MKNCTTVWAPGAQDHKQYNVFTFPALLAMRMVSPKRREGSNKGVGGSASKRSAPAGEEFPKLAGSPAAEYHYAVNHTHASD